MRYHQRCQAGACALYGSEQVRVLDGERVTLRLCAGHAIATRHASGHTWADAERLAWLIGLCRRDELTARRRAVRYSARAWHLGRWGDREDAHPLDTIRNESQAVGWAAMADAQRDEAHRARTQLLTLSALAADRRTRPIGSCRWCGRHLWFALDRRGACSETPHRDGRPCATYWESEQRPSHV